MMYLSHKSYEMAKSLKDDDAKLKGLKYNTKSASYRILFLTVLVKAIMLRRSL